MDKKRLSNSVSAVKDKPKPIVPVAGVPGKLPGISSENAGKNTKMPPSKTSKTQRTQADHRPESEPTVKDLPTPLVQPLSRITNRDFSMVFFDLETGGLRTGKDILQIAAIFGDQEFSCYVTPTQTISNTARTVTGLSAKKGILSLHGEPVKSVPIAEALRSFLRWLQPFSPCILLTHNVSFDARHIVHHLHANQLFDRFTGIVCGFCDTLSMFRELHPGRKIYRLQVLVSDILHESYDAHNAIYDVKVLQDLAEFSGVNKKMARKHSRQCDYWENLAKYKADVKEKKDTLQGLVSQNALSKRMAHKMAANGYDISYLKTTCENEGLQGLTSSLKPVTKNMDIITKLFESMSIDN